MTIDQVENTPVDNRYRTVTLTFAGDGECSACGHEETPLYSGGELARVCPACVAATFPPPPWEGDCPPEKADVVITHTRADGTLLEGSRKGDGIIEAIRSHGWRFFPSLGCLGLYHSRDRSADRYKIDPAAKAIRELGFTVCVVVNEDARRAFADAEADREERAESRTERFEDRASSATASSGAAYERSKQIGERFYMGQPILVGHHSEGRARRDHARMDNAMRKSIQEGERAKHWAQRAEASGAYTEHRTNPARTLRRIETKEADLRGVVRWQRGESNNGHSVRLSPAVVGELSRRRDELTEEVGYWRSIVAKAEAEGFKVWGADDFTKGDFVRSRGSWYEVLRVNKKTLTVAWNLRSPKVVMTVADATYEDGHVGRQPVDYSDVKTRMSAGDMARYLERNRTPSIADAKALMDGVTAASPQDQDQEQAPAEVEGSADIPERLRALLVEGEQMRKLPESEWSFTSTCGRVYRVRMVTGRDVTDLHFQVRTVDATGTAIGVGKDWPGTLEVIREHATAAGEHEGKQCQRCGRMWGKGLGSPQTPATCTPGHWSYCDRAAVPVGQDVPENAQAKPKTKKRRTSGPKMVIVTAAYGSRQARMVYANGRGTVREDIPAVFIDAPEGVTFNEGPASAAIWQGVDEVLEKAGFVRLVGSGARSGIRFGEVRAKITEREDTEPVAVESAPQSQGTDSPAS
ncbi:DUF3560 domain-containing protein [Streptomyces sp. NPDC049950]|uniref:DUF3560 domain-containing protein n=1 Tax=Streptomyces sp. NPDC049950 TaxID=3156659 RepID=UPI0034217AA9